MSEGRGRILEAVRGRYNVKTGYVIIEEIANIIECACRLEGALYRSKDNPNNDLEVVTKLFNLRKSLEGVFGSKIPCNGHGEEEIDE